MATYHLRSEPPKRLLSLRWKLPIWIAGSLLVAYLSFSTSLHPQWLGQYARLAGSVTNIAAGLAVAVVVLSGVWLAILPRIIRTRRLHEYEVTPEGVIRRYPSLPDLFLPNDEIAGFVMRRNSMVIQPQERARTIVVPELADGFTGLRQELIARGIPELSENVWQRYRGVWMFAVYFTPLMLCISVFFTRKDPIEVAVSGGCYVAFLAWMDSRRSRSPYFQPGKRWLRLATPAIWTLLVVLRVWAVAHPHQAHLFTHHASF
jgi:hypothetical protein